MDALIDATTSDTSTTDTTKMQQNQSNQSNGCDCHAPIGALACHSPDNMKQNRPAAAVDIKHQSLKVEHCVSYCQCSHNLEPIQSAVFSPSNIEPDPLKVSKDKIAIPVIKIDTDTDVKQRSSIGHRELDALQLQLSVTPYNASDTISANLIDMTNGDGGGDAAKYCSIQFDSNPRVTSWDKTTKQDMNVPVNGLDAPNTQHPNVTILLGSKRVAGQSQPTIQRRKMKNASVTFARNSNKSHGLSLANGANANAAKRFKCDLCDYSAEKEAYVKSHRRTHSDERPYQCEICEKRYRQKSGLNYHMKSHGHLFAFQCTKCRRGFTQEDQWESHENKCTAKSYECHLCGQKFHQRKANLLAHFRRKHFGDLPIQRACSGRWCRVSCHINSTSTGQMKQQNKTTRQ